MKPNDIPTDTKEETNRLLHDLMNPLTVIMGYAQLMTNRDDLPKDILQQAKEIYEQAVEVSNIAQKIKQIVVNNESKRSNTVLVVDPEGDVFSEIQDFTCKRMDFYHAKDLQSASDFIRVNPVRTVLINVNQLSLDDVLVQLNTARPGIDLVLVTNEQNGVKELKALGYPVLVRPLDESIVLNKINPAVQTTNDD